MSYHTEAATKQEWAARALMAEAENKRLKAALSWIASTKPHHAGQTANEYYFQERAREALAAAKGE